jgi:dGTPase
MKISLNKLFSQQEMNYSFANIKNMTSELIERFVSDVQINNNKLIVPNYIFEEIAILKSFSHIYFINTPPQLELKNTQDKIINKVYKKFAKNPQNMQNEFYDEYTKANNTMLKKRIIIDQIASLTDESIMLI